MNKLIVKLEKKLYNSRSFESGQTIYFDPSWHPEEYAVLKATVISLPTGIINRQDYNGYNICMNVGDELLIRYDVVFAYHDQPDRDSPIYKNLIFQYNENTGRYEELWICDILQVFAVIKESKYCMINGFVMLDIITEKKADFTSRIIRPDNYKDLVIKNKAIIKAVPTTSLPIRTGDIVYINPQTVMRYQLNMEAFFIIKEQYLLGLEA